MRVDVCMTGEGKGQKQWKEPQQLWEFLASDLFSQLFRPGIPTDVVFIYRSGTADKVIHQMESEVRVNCRISVRGKEYSKP